MLTEYLQLIKVWLKIQKDFNTLVEDIHLNDAVDQCWEVKMTEFSKAIKHSPPVPGLARGLFFLLEATRAKFEARKELATIARLHERQKLLSCKMQEEIWYDKWVTEQEALHEATIDDIKEDLENLAREKVEANEIRSGHECNV
ncbi:hypothetical protein PCANC_18373 [Puccinia coronata f. sp. avenae]|uniref:Dynein heavy chain tail domain-containing protein n=1 Tax=Puccinia coronata f. sp. avenae TaxID=200324 RepID=A0A2N5V1C3_9BASI|nr:hypothetical protein PCANC_18373 [Puccinia coronata f. sp. avenae]